MGIGDWGLGIGDWNPQSPIPNPHFLILINLTYAKNIYIIKLNKILILMIIKILLQKNIIFYSSTIDAKPLFSIF